MTTEPMKISEAMRSGIALGPQAKEALYRTQDGSLCAWGTAIAGRIGLDGLIGYITESWPYKDILAAVFDGVDTTQQVVYPVEDGSDGKMPLNDTVVTLNDADGWTRERIADWLESEGL